MSGCPSRALTASAEPTLRPPVRTAFANTAFEEPMYHPVVIKASALIEVGDIVGAESELANLVETEGANALVVAMDQLPPKDLLALVREYDASKMSVINMLITPDQFAKAVVLERLYGDKTHEQLRSLINSVVFRDDVDSGEFIEAMGNTQGGSDTLADYLQDRFAQVCLFAIHGTFNTHDVTRLKTEDIDALMESGDLDASPAQVSREEVMDHDWMELTWLLAHEHEDVFREILSLLASRRQKWILNGGEDADASATTGSSLGVHDSDEESAL